MRISRTKIESFIRCPRCAMLEMKHRVPKLPSFPFTLNNAVDELLKREFDTYRERGVPHPLMVEAGIEAVPFQHPELERWRDALRRGIEHKMPELGVTFTGGIDDVWQSRDGTLHVVDYKATSKIGSVSLDAEWQRSYRRQIEIYQWLFRRNGFRVSDTAYFVYTNARKDLDDFADRLLFRTVILPLVGDDSWVEGTVDEMVRSLGSPTLPRSAVGCDFCNYRVAARRWE